MLVFNTLLAHILYVIYTQCVEIQYSMYILLGTYVHTYIQRCMNLGIFSDDFSVAAAYISVLCLSAV